MSLFQNRYVINRFCEGMLILPGMRDSCFLSDYPHQGLTEKARLIYLEWTSALPKTGMGAVPYLKLLRSLFTSKIKLLRSLFTS